MDATAVTEKPAWRVLPSGDWAYERAGERLGTVVFQDLIGPRAWYSVSAAKSHGPEEGTLTACKRRIEALWREATGGPREGHSEVSAGRTGFTDDGFSAG